MERTNKTSNTNNNKNSIDCIVKFFLVFIIIMKNKIMFTYTTSHSHYNQIKVNVNSLCYTNNMGYHAAPLPIPKHENSACGLVVLLTPSTSPSLHL